MKFLKLRWKLPWKRKLGLALGGGAARGMAHIGVIKVLEEEDVDVSFVAGTSAGSLMGALYCAGLGWREMREIAGSINWGDIVSPAFDGMGMVSARKLEKVLNEVIGEREFTDLDRQFSVVATDIQTGEPVVLSTGSVSHAVRASCSIPGIFAPTTWGDRILVDGGLVDDVPVDIVRDMGADAVVGVDLNEDRGHADPPDNLIDVFYQSLNILIYNAAKSKKRTADIMISPDLAGFKYYSLRRIDELVAAGEDACRRWIPALKTFIS